MEVKIRSRYLKEFIVEIQYQNRNPRNIKALKLLDDLDTNPVRVLHAGTELFRCRIISDETKINKEKDFFGYGKKDSFVPPASVTRDLRANYRYIPYLYCSNDAYTALVEVRPRLGSQVSVATIRVNEELRLLDFTMANIPSKMSEAKQNLFSDLSALYSKPVTDDDDVLDYIPTQYIAEYAKNLGYDGIIFTSSLMPEIHNEIQVELRNKAPISFKKINFDRFNAVIFDYQKCEPVKSNVMRTFRNFMEFRQNDDDKGRLNVKSALDELLAKT